MIRGKIVDARIEGGKICGRVDTPLDGYTMQNVELEVPGVTLCERTDAGEGWHECKACSQFWYGGRKCWRDPVPWQWPTWRTILIGVAGWVLILAAIYLTFWGD